RVEAGRQKHYPNTQKPRDRFTAISALVLPRGCLPQRMQSASHGTICYCSRVEAEASRFMARVEKTVFICYRRTNAAWTQAIYQYLTWHGYDVFYDIAGLGSGDFEAVIGE